MKIILADKMTFENVKSIVMDTIKEIYPHYYPAGAVDFFIIHHSDDNIMHDINKGIVYLITDEEKAVGTVTLQENEINRLFVLPQYQGMGYGKALLDFAENNILEHYDTIRLHASFAAKHIYLKRGYTDIEYHKIKTENEDYLCVDIMEKIFKEIIY